MNYDILIKNGIFITPGGRIFGNMGIRDGKIISVSSDQLSDSGSVIFDAKGYFVLPGCVDMHVHVNDPGRTEWEDWPHATAAAAAGGITTIADMPINSFPAVVNRENLELKTAAAANRTYVDYVLWGGLTNENAGDIHGMQEAGVIAFKAFMSASGIPDFSSAGNTALLEGLKQTAGTDSFVGVHAECDSIYEYLSTMKKAEGRKDPLAWSESRPVCCETEAIGRFLSLLSASGGNGHICHVSTEEGALMIHEAQKRGISVTFETCTGYLTFTENDFSRQGPVLKCAPPLRTAENREKLWELIKNGIIPIVSSDHSPCTPELKEKGQYNIWAAWGGISGIQTTLLTMLTEGCYKRGLTLEQLVSVCAENPARRLGLEGQKGVLQPGADADLVVIDPEKEWILKEEHLFTKNKISPLIGETMHGQVLHTFLRGKEIFRNGKIQGNPTGKRL